MSKSKGQESLELLLGYTIAIAVIGTILYVIFSLFPSITSTTTVPSYSGFSGFIVQQGYISSQSFYYLDLQNVLNENIKLDAISLIVNGVNYTNFKCSKSYLPALETVVCNLTSVPFGNSFSGQGYIYYTPTNISSAPVIASVGNVVN